jgi:DNA repair photolyase
MKIGITERGDGGLSFNKVKKAIDKKEVDGAIVITKCPSKLVNELDYLKERQNIMVHATITGLGGSIIEPNVNTADYELEAYKTLYKAMNGRVVLRIDPIIFIPDYLKMAVDVLQHALGRVRISFLDTYPHVRERFNKAGIETNDFMHYSLESRQQMLIAMQSIVNAKMCGATNNIEICGEPGMECTGCVSQKDINMLGLNHLLGGLKGHNSRLSCCCIADKVELLNSCKPCKHGCLYCYWAK